MTEPLEDDEIVLHTWLLRDIVRRRLVLWMLLGGVALAAFLGYGLLMLPQTFTATASLLISQPASSGSPLAALVGGGASRKHIGILKARQTAERVERAVHLQEFYHLPTKRKALELLMGGLKVDDNPGDGLVYISESLPGPARLAPDPEGRRAQVRNKTADVANAYVRALRYFYTNSDNDRDAVLLRTADHELADAKYQADLAEQRMNDFLRATNGGDPRANPAAGSGGTAELAPLYTALSGVEADLKDAEAANETQEKMVGQMLSRPTQIAPEDRLLQQARQAYTDAITNLRILQVTFADDSPEVVAARRRVKIREDALKQAVAGIKQTPTTEKVEAAQRVEGLRAKQRSLMAQIATAENRLRRRGALTPSYERLRAELDERRRMLETVMTRAAEVRLSAVSSQSQLQVVDDAVAPEIGSPGITKVASVSLAILLIAAILWLGIEYVATVRKLSARNPEAALALLSPPARTT